MQNVHPLNNRKIQANKANSNVINLSFMAEKRLKIRATNRVLLYKIHFIQCNLRNHRTHLGDIWINEAHILIGCHIPFPNWAPIKFILHLGIKFLTPFPIPYHSIFWSWNFIKVESIQCWPEGSCPFEPKRRASS